MGLPDKRCSGAWRMRLSLFFDRMPKLTAAQKAAAIHFGHFPASENIGVDVSSVQYAANSAVRGGNGADAGLIPLGEPLGAAVKKPRVLAMPDTSTRRRPGKANSSKKRNSKKPIEIVVLDEKNLSVPSGRRKDGTRRVAANSREGRRLLRQAAREGSSEAQAYLDNLKTAKKQPVQTAKAEPVKSQSFASKAPAAAKVPNPSKSSAGNQVTPGFVTLSQESEQKNKAVPSVVSASKSPPDLVSSSVERRVKVGNVNPPKNNKLSETGSGSRNVASISTTKQSSSATGKPVQLVNFDLANTGRNLVGRPTQTAQADVERKPLADIMKSISVPETERKTDIVPVDLEKIEPAQKKKTETDPAKKGTKKAEPKKEEHPKRYWVQLATGSNISALKYDFRRMKRKNEKLFGKMDGWTSPWGKTRRMVIGPFDDLSSAKKFDSAFRKNGGDSFAWVSAKGTKVNKLP